jgi:serine/threonine protein kinase
MNRLSALNPGFKLGTYELALRIATGGMGEVWAARARGTRGFKRVVALKLLLAERSANPKFEQMFLDEAKLASRLTHPNVVHVVDLGKESEILYQVMEWVDGLPLWSVMRAAAAGEGMPLDVAARIICQICTGLHAAHELKDDDGKSFGLVHRDVTPQNILVTPDGLVKVVDFGVAKFAGRAAPETEVGELRGKVPYMAPEHILGRKLDRRADVFSIGLLFYQLVAGTHPFLGDSDQLTMARIASPTPASPLRSRVPTISEELSKAVADALAKSPNARTKSALDFMHAIEKAVPGSILDSNNTRVATFLRRIMSEQFDARAEQLASALQALDARATLSDAERATAPDVARSISPPAEPARPKPDAAPVAASDANDGPSVTPPAFTGPPRKEMDSGEPLETSQEAAPQEAAPQEPAPKEAAPQEPASWLQRQPRKVKIAAAVGAAVGLISVIAMLSSGDAPDSPAGAGAPSGVPLLSSMPPARQTAVPSSPTVTAEPTATAAVPTASATAEPTATATASGTAVAPTATSSVSVAPRGTGAPVKGPIKKPEYTPGTL